ncbi:hypothetical protein GOBAR_DD28495 [Gossypium barbadense]|nr:hypothetical protein GOBAR_DD28495 [Gossypium barbadense]
MKVWELTNASLDQAPRRLKRESKTRRKEEMKILWWVSLVFVITNVGALAEEPQLSSPRVVFQTNYGDIEFGFYPSVAPKTVDHIFKLVRLGCYNTNHFFRVDRGFVAQVADVASGRSAPMNEEQIKEAEKTIVGEFSDVKHVRGILSMGRYSDPDSAQSSFSILLGDAPHLDGQYAIFGKVTKGDETLRKLEELPTHREGIFVMPVERITILSSYYYEQKRLLKSSDGEIEFSVLRIFNFLGRLDKRKQLPLKMASSPTGVIGWPKGLSHDPSLRLLGHDHLTLLLHQDTELESCKQERGILKQRLAASAVEIERQRMKCFP